MDTRARLILAIDNNDTQSIEQLIQSEAIYPSYQTYAQSLRKFPSDELYQEYLKELTEHLKSDASFPLLTTERLHVVSRKTWTDLVSDMDRINQECKTRVNVKKQMCQRLECLGYRNVEKLYERSLAYLRDNTAIVVTFSANTFKDMTDYRLLNAYERTNFHEDSSPPLERHTCELGLFSSSEIKSSLISNIHIRPRYGVLVLLDRKHGISPAHESYGRSYLVLRNIAKYNSLFVSCDSLNYKVNFFNNNFAGNDLVPCTYHHLELILYQCGIKKLKAIMDWVETGSTSNQYSHQHGFSQYVEENSYIEVLLPSINFLDSALVEHIHIQESELKLTADDVATFTALGINISNGNENPYIKFKDEFMQCVKDNLPERVANLLSSHPSLILTNDEGYSALHVALMHKQDKMAGFLVSLGADVTAVAPDGLTPLHRAAKFCHYEFLRDHYADAFEVLRLMLDNAFIGYKTTDPIRLKAENKIEEIYQQLQKEIANRMEILLGCIEAERCNAQNLHTKQFIMWKEHSGFAERLQSAKTSFLQYLNQDLNIDDCIEAYHRHTGKVKGETQNHLLPTLAPRSK